MSFPIQDCRSGDRARVCEEERVTGLSKAPVRRGISLELGCKRDGLVVVLKDLIKRLGIPVDSVKWRVTRKGCLHVSVDVTLRSEVRRSWDDEVFSRMRRRCQRVSRSALALMCSGRTIQRIGFARVKGFTL